MTHLNTSYQLPVRTGTSPMEDAIVQQVEWYMGQVNLEKDEFLKQKMDDDLWVSLDVILNFPKMIRMGVTDKRRVATLLNARSTVVEVDEKAARIRPAWARRSSLVIHNVPLGTRRDQIAALFHIPSPTADPNSTVPPPASHPAGLVTIQPLADSVWVAMFDSPSGAEAALPLVLHKSVDGQEITAETHVENVLPPARSDLQPARNQSSVYQSSNNVHHDPSNPSHQSYPQMPPMMSAPMMNGQMMTPVPMPLPVMHPSPELHHQYTYTHAAATYMAPQGYAPPGVPVPSAYIGAHRGVPHGYVMSYHHQPMSYEQQAHIAQSHPMPASQAPNRDNPTMMPAASIPEDISNGQVPNGFHSTSGASNGAVSAQNSHNDGTNGKEFIREQSTIQIHADSAALPQLGHQVYSTGMQIATIPGQPIETPMAPVSVRDQDMRAASRPAMDGHFGAVMVDSPRPMYNRNRGSMSGGNRDRAHPKNFHEGGSRQGTRSMANGEGRSGPHRKGKKGNRNSMRHGGHGQHDRQVDARPKENRGEGSGSDTGNREDRRNAKEEKPRTEPNFASMNFPPLPGGQNLYPRVPASSNKKTVDREASAPEPAVPKPVAAMTIPAIIPEPVESSSATPGSPISSDRPPAALDIKNDPGVSRKNSGQADLELEGTSRSYSDTTMESDRVVEPTVLEKKPAEGKNQSQASPSPMSYAAILRSKKPTAHPLSVSTRSNSEGALSTGANETDVAFGPSQSNGSLKDKERVGKKKKNNGHRSADSSDGFDKHSGSSGSANALVKVSSKSSSGFGSGQPAEGATKDGLSKAKSVIENSRARSVWANKPKSLFQAAPVAPAMRPTTPQQTLKSQKVTSPVSSHEEEKDQSGEAGKTQLLNSAVVKRDATEAAEKDKLRSVSAHPCDSADRNSFGDDEGGRELSEDNQISSGAKERSATGDQAPNGSAKGAWATGGPRSWPKTKSHVKVAKNTTVSES
ncbi:unnamed protein product [Agarophyton chilense]|eukprot:gb/GEZJ01000623.1/.p1 GENE.gb/GEZJ01000623.1/~~gb/GEZJ01000623.1/.p1  ORF type:complete len:975 (+),score=147.56 gb/GEZJ01000623.1/:568-3492(+)